MRCWMLIRLVQAPVLCKPVSTSPGDLLGALGHRRLEPVDDGFAHAGNGQQIKHLMDGSPIVFGEENRVPAFTRLN